MVIKDVVYVQIKRLIHTVALDKRLMQLMSHVARTRIHGLDPPRNVHNNKATKSLLHNIFLDCGHE